VPGGKPSPELCSRSIETVRMNLLLRILVAMQFAIVPVLSQNTQLTPEDMPNWENMNGCSQIMYLGATQLINVLECGTWLCVCEHFPQAMSAAQSLASSYCGTSDTQDIASATSVLNALCYSISATVSEPAGPTTDSGGECIYVS
jgi:hypothetical protein